MKTDGIRVMAENGGTLTEYKSINSACEAYGIGHDRLIRLIIKGEQMDGVCFDWSIGNDADDLIEQIEQRYSRRISFAAEYKRRRRSRCSTR